MLTRSIMVALFSGSDDFMNYTPSQRPTDCTIHRSPYDAAPDSLYFQTTNNLVSARGIAIIRCHQSPMYSAPTTFPKKPPLLRVVEDIKHTLLRLLWL